MAKTGIRATLAGNIRRLADARGLTINAVADFSGVSRSHLHAVLACERAASVDWLEKVGKTLEVSPAELLRPK